MSIRAAAASLLLLAAAGAVPLAAAEHHGGRRQFGGDRAVTVADLPACRLRARLEGLPAKARGRALAALSAMRFDEDEIGDLLVDDGGGVAIACFPRSVAAAPAGGAPIVA